MIKTFLPDLSTWNRPEQPQLMGLGLDWQFANINGLQTQEPLRCHNGPEGNTRISLQAAFDIIPFLMKHGNRGNVRCLTSCNWGLCQVQNSGPIDVSWAGWLFRSLCVGHWSFHNRWFGILSLLNIKNIWAQWLFAAYCNTWTSQTSTTVIQHPQLQFLHTSLGLAQLTILIPHFGSIINLVGGAITILKNMSSSMGRMTSHIWNGK